MMLIRVEGKSKGKKSNGRVGRGKKIFLYGKVLKFGRGRTERCTDGKRKQRGGKGKVAKNRKVKV